VPCHRNRLVLAPMLRSTRTDKQLSRDFVVGAAARHHADHLTMRSLSSARTSKEIARVDVLEHEATAPARSAAYTYSWSSSVVRITTHTAIQPRISCLMDVRVPVLDGVRRHASNNRQEAPDACSWRALPNNSSREWPCQACGRSGPGRGPMSTYTSRYLRMIWRSVPGKRPVHHHCVRRDRYYARQGPPRRIRVPTPAVDQKVIRGRPPPLRAPLERLRRAARHAGRGPPLPPYPAVRPKRHFRRTCGRVPQ